jgi:hypothetical protein
VSLPYPTPNRLKLVDEITRGEVRWYHFLLPQAINAVTDRTVTSRVAELVKAGLAQIPDGEAGRYSLVRLTPEGMAWVTRARTEAGGR